MQRINGVYKPQLQLRGTTLYLWMLISPIENIGTWSFLTKPPSEIWWTGVESNGCSTPRNLRVFWHKLLRLEDCMWPMRASLSLATWHLGHPRSAYPFKAFPAGPVENTAGRKMSFCEALSERKMRQCWVCRATYQAMKTGRFFRLLPLFKDQTVETLSCRGNKFPHDFPSYSLPLRLCK